MAKISLPKLPEGEEFEEYISAFFQCGGYHIDRKLIERGEDEILELDVITTDYQSKNVPDIRLLEIKSGGWGFSDIFKVKGWMVYLNLTDGKFVVREKREAEDYFRDKAKTLQIDLICIPDLKETAEILKPFTSLRECTEDDIHLWRFSYWVERKLLSRLYALKKANRQVRSYEALAEYFFLINNRTFFTSNIVARVEKLYRAFQKFPHISAKCANESLGKSFDRDYEKLPDEVFRKTYFDCQLNDVAISSFIEHRARLAILKNAIDYTIYKAAGDQDKTRAMHAIKIGGAEIDFLPHSFKDGLEEIAEEPYFYRYAVFWQWFMWFFGGFILTDLEKEEYALLSKMTQIPVAQIPSALAAYEKVFPIRNGWFVYLGAECRVRSMKLMSLPFMGIGANVRRIVYASTKVFKDIPVRGKYTVHNLVLWNNATAELLKK